MAGAAGGASRHARRRGCCVAGAVGLAAPSTGEGKSAMGDGKTSMAGLAGPAAAAAGTTQVPPSSEELHGEFTEHMMDTEAVLARFGASFNLEDPKASAGLTQGEATRRLGVYGRNVLTPPYKKPEWLRFLEKFADRFVLLLLLAGTLSMAMTGQDIVNLYLGIILNVVCIVSCFLSYREEGKVSALMDTFKKMLPTKSKVIRDGSVKEIPADELVVGDICLIGAGDQVPADCRLLTAVNLRVECSSLTGESEPITLNTNTCVKEHAPANEAVNVAFSSSLVIEGTAMGVVVRTSDQTLLGKIASVASKVEKGKTTLEVEVDRLVNFITVLSLVMATVVFAGSMLQGNDFSFSFINGFVVIIIANVPQGLQLTVMVALNVSGRKLAAKNVYVKSLKTVETLGSASCICTDKTGTLTQNIMSACHLWVGGQVLHANQLTMGESSRIHFARNKDLKLITNIAAICNKAAYNDPDFTLFDAATAGLTKMDVAKLSSSDLRADGTIAAVSKGGSQSRITPNGGGVAITMAAGVNKGSESRLTVGAGAAGAGSFVRVGGKRPSLMRVNNGYGSTRGVNAPVGGQPQQGINLLAELQAGGTGGLSPRASDLGGARRVSVQRRQSTLGGMGGKGALSETIEAAARPDDATVPTTGDASDVGIMKFCDKINPISDTRSKFVVLCEQPFNSTNKYSACIIRPEEEDEDQRRILWLKGAPEIVLKMCTSHSLGGQVKPKDGDFQEHYDDAYKSFAKQGERVLGFAMMRIDAAQFPPAFDRSYKPGQDGQWPVLQGLTFVGLLSLVDPPRIGVKEAVQTCRRAGVKVIMVTGDHPLTGGAIARKVGIIGEFYTAEEVAEAQGVKVENVDQDQVGAIVVHGHQLFGKDQAYWDFVLSHNEIVFARTTPEQKLEIVKNCQRLGEVVAVTGDGVNDAPALRQADIGIAMGTVGSDVSRDAANVVLVTNDWSTIVHGIEEGRVIFENLVKSIAYTLSHLLAEVVPSVLALLIGFPFLISSLLVLMIDLGTEMCPAISLSYEPAENGLMLRPPRDMVRDRLVSRNLLLYSYMLAGMLEAAVSFLAAFLVFHKYGIGMWQLPFSFSQKSDSLWSAVSPPLNISSGRCVDPSSGALSPAPCSYSGAQQVTINDEVHAAYFIGLVGSQVMHIWVLRSRYVPSWEILHSNIVCQYGVVIEIFIMTFIVYMPFTQKFFTTQAPYPLVWVCPIIFAAVIWPFVDGRKVWARMHPGGKVDRWLSW